MDITLTLDTREYVDLMNPPKLDNGSDIILSQDRERDDFKRTVEDLRIRVSDQDNKLTTLLRNYPITSLWDVAVKDEGRQLFAGRISRPVSFDVQKDWISIQSYSKNKDFWEKAKNTLIWRFNRPTTFTILSSGYGVFSTVAIILQANCSLIADGVFNGFEIHSLYSSRPIRFAWDDIDPNTGNNGRYEDLDPNTTVFQLLTAMGKYYNAEIFVDPETDKLCMLPRNAVQNDVEHNLDELLINNEEIRYDDTESKKYDYVHSFIAIAKPEPMQEYGTYRTDYLSSHQYCYTNYFTSGVESVPSDVASFRMVAYGSDFVPAFFIPSPPQDVIQQRLYRKDTDGKFRLSFVLTSTSAVTFAPYIQNVAGGIYMQDFGARNSLTGNTVLINKVPTGHVWWRYNESTGQWSTVIGYENQNQPIGRIYDIIPELTFLDANGKPLPASSFDVFAFFGKETSLQIFAQQWKDLFVTKGKLFCSVKGLPYRLGDSFVATNVPKIPSGKYVVKKAVGNLLKSTTKLELIKV